MYMYTCIFETDPPDVMVKYNNYGLPSQTSATLWCYVDAYPPVDVVNITWVLSGHARQPAPPGSTLV